MENGKWKMEKGWWKMRFLFQGDSITDAGRDDYENPRSMGAGYVHMLEDELIRNGHEVYNCGISGNRVTDLLARWKKDCLNLKPDVLTILVGVNDVWHEVLWANGVRTELFEEIYRILLRETAAALPDTKVILMGAYVLRGESTKEKWELFDGEVKARRQITKKLAKEFGLKYVDLQEVFDKAQEEREAAYWSQDGVHPTQAGHGLIARAWKGAAGDMFAAGRPGC